MAYDPNYTPSGGLNFTPTASSPLYGGGFSGTAQGGWNQGNYFMNQPQSQPMTFGAATQPQFQQQDFTQQQPMQQAGGGGGGANPMQSVLGLVQVAGGVMGAKKLQKEEYPSYKPISALQQAKVRSGQFAQMGYTPEQTANFRQDLARIGNEDYLNAINLSGGSLSRALNSRRNTMRFGALNQFAQGDAAQRMSNIRYDDSITGQLQSLANMETQNKLQRRIMLEQAYGQAIKTGTENITNSFDSGQALKMIAGGM